MAQFPLHMQTTTHTTRHTFSMHLRPVGMLNPARSAVRPFGARTCTSGQCNIAGSMFGDCAHPVSCSEDLRSPGARSLRSLANPLCRTNCFSHFFCVTALARSLANGRASGRAAARRQPARRTVSHGRASASRASASRASASRVSASRASASKPPPPSPT